MSSVNIETKVESILQAILKVDDDSNETPKVNKKLMKRKSMLKVKPGMGAEALWKELQRTSREQLIKMDRKISDDLKRSYGAHLRNNISKNKPICMRNFTENNDVNNIEMLYDNTEREKMQVSIQHTNIMYRRSQQNMEKTSILLENDRRNELALENTLDEFFPENEFSKPVLEISDSEESVRSDMAEVENEEVSNDEDFQGNLLFLTEMNDDNFVCENEVATNEGEINEDFRVKFSRQKPIAMITDVPGYNSESRSQTAETKSFNRIVRPTEDLLRHNKNRHSEDSDEIKISDLVEYSAHTIVSRSSSRPNRDSN